MDKLFIVANLKSNQTKSEAKDWLLNLREIKDIIQALSNKEIILCPSFTLLEIFAQFISDNNLPIKLGAQNVSPFEEGPYTGEVNAKQIKEFAEYILIGHSERRNNFNETDDILLKKVEISLKHGLKPIYLVQGSNELIPAGIELVTYEPIFAIGSGNPDTPENAKIVATRIKENGKYMVLYGGSVSSENIKSFTSSENINGVLIGKASLDAKEFIKIIQNA